MSILSEFYCEDIKNTQRYVEKLSRGGLSKFPPLIISCAITGGNQGKESNPNLPESVDEQVQQTYDAYNAGASIVHVHGRGPEPEKMGYNTTSPEVYKEVYARIREKCPDIIINNTAICGKWWTEEDGLIDATIPSVEAKPEMASVDVTNYTIHLLKRKRPAPLLGIDEDYMGKVNYTISPDDIDRALKHMKEYGVKPEFEMFGMQDVHYLQDLVNAGKIEGPHWASMIFGGSFNYPVPQVLQATIDLLPKETMLNCITVGAAQFPFITMAMILGCHVRVGMEDNYYISKGQLAESNAQLVDKVVRIAKELGRPIATPDKAREMIGLGKPRQY